MTARIAPLALALLLAAGPGLAQEGKKAEPAPADPEATVLFTNGSLVRMTVRQENFEVTTEFGKLIADETDKWGKIVKLVGIKQE